MTKNEALKAAIDGKKIRLPHFHKQEYVIWHETCFAFHYENGHLEKATFSLERNDNWEIVPDYVDFAEAWKAYQKEKVIQSVQTGNKKNKSCGILQKFDEFEISGKWLILEDNS